MAHCHIHGSPLCDVHANLVTVRGLKYSHGEHRCCMHICKDSAVRTIYHFLTFRILHAHTGNCIAAQSWPAWGLEHSHRWLAWGACTYRILFVFFALYLGRVQLARPFHFILPGLVILSFYEAGAACYPLTHFIHSEIFSVGNCVGVCGVETCHASLISGTVWIIRNICASAARVHVRVVLHVWNAVKTA